MKILFSSALILMSHLLISMESPSPSPKHSPEGATTRAVVLRYFRDLAQREAAAQIVKDSNYFKEQLRSSAHHPVVTPPVFMEQQVIAGPMCVHDGKGVICAANTIFMVDLAQEKITRMINIPPRVEPGDITPPTVSVIDSIRMVGVPRDLILLGETHGRILIADPSFGQAGQEVKTFGQLDGHILQFAVDKKGKKIAVRYTSKDAAGNALPCFALAAAFKSRIDQANIAQSAASKRRSWAPPKEAAQWRWSDFFWRPCLNGIKTIGFEGSECVTECSTGTREKWRIKHLTKIDKVPELVKVSEVKAADIP